MSVILTASWSTPLPPGATPIGVSRGVPRNRRGFRRMRELEPGSWFKSVPPETYVVRYSAILARLDAAKIRNRMFALGTMPVLICYERAADIQAARCYCHRHLIAEWLEASLGIDVAEVDYPDLDRFAHLRSLGIDPPRARAHRAVAIRRHT